MEFRPAHAADAEALARLMHAAIDAHAASAYDDAERMQWKGRVDPGRLATFLADPQERFLVAEEEGTVLGFGARNGRLLRLLYVAPEAMGRGLGRTLMARLEADARADGETEMELEASRNAQAFYRALGYAPTTQVGCGGDALLCTRMSKRL